MDIKNLENEPYAIVISMHLNNYLNFYGDDAKFYLEYALSLPQGMLELMDFDGKTLDAAQAAVRLIYNLQNGFPTMDITKLVKELYSEAV